MTDNFLQAPVKLERMDCEICVTDHKLKRAGSALERPEDAIELSREETSVPGSRWQLPETEKKETEKNAIFK